MSKNTITTIGPAKQKKRSENIRPIRYEEQHPVRKKKKKHYLRTFLIIAAVIATLAGIMYLFHIRETVIKGNKVTTEKQINNWLNEDKGYNNGLYLFLKTKYGDVTYPPGRKCKSSN